MKRRAANLRLFLAGLLVLTGTFVLHTDLSTDAPGYSMPATVLSTKAVLQRVDTRIGSAHLLDLPRFSRPAFLSGFYALPGSSLEHGRLIESASFDKARIGVLHFLRPLYILLKILII